MMRNLKVDMINYKNGIKKEIIKNSKNLYYNKLNLEN